MSLPASPRGFLQGSYLCSNLSSLASESLSDSLLTSNCYFFFATFLRLAFFFEAFFFPAFFLEAFFFAITFPFN